MKGTEAYRKQGDTWENQGKSYMKKPLNTEHIENYWKSWKQNGKREYKLSEVGAPGLLLRRALDGNKSLALGVAQV